jgi:4-hydroxy 2-oxovalerate aldolase
MKRIKLLDCTLRDGGFVNNWNFGEDCITNIVERLELAGIDIIEVGYLRDYVDDDVNMTQFSGTRAITKLLEKSKNKLNKNSLYVAIVDYGNCTQDNIERCSDTVLDGIRVTFKREELADALDYCDKLKQKGYLVSLQPVSFMDYTPEDVLKLVKCANELDPYAVCIVDTYGFMNKRDLLRYYSLMDATLNADILLGYHSHNNFQLAYSNAVELMEQFTDRNMIIDCSVMGMGKGAGNAATELLAMYMNQSMGGSYNLDHILEIADVYIEKLRMGNSWGYNLKYYIAACDQCHHKYVSFLLDKKTLSIKSINDIINNIPKENKTKYNESLIKQLYQQYQENDVNDNNDYEWLRKRLENQKILVVAPGNSLMSEREKIASYIEENSPYIINVNHVADFIKPSAIFISNSKRYAQIALRLKRYPSDVEIILTSNINPTSLKPSCILNYSDLLIKEKMIEDNSTLMLFGALKKAGVTEVAVAGFDGYRQGENNYFSDQWSFVARAHEHNEVIRETVRKMGESIRIDFITSTLYQ